MNKEEIELLNDILVSFDEYDVDWTKTACERNAEVIRKLQTQLTEANGKLEKIKEMFVDEKLINLNKYYCGDSYECDVHELRKDILEIIKGK